MNRKIEESEKDFLLKMKKQGKDRTDLIEMIAEKVIEKIYQYSRDGKIVIHERGIRKA